MLNEDDGATNHVPSSVSGFWRRIGALALDGFVLGAGGMALGFAMYDQLVELGQLGRIIGFAIAIAYFGLLNSHLGSGQTIGKRLLGIRVINIKGQPIGLGSATLRAVILTLPWALNGLFISDLNSLLLETGLSLAVFGIGGSIVYLFVANRRSRQSLHDLVAHTWVVRVDSRVTPPSGLPRLHVAVVTTLLATSLLLPPLISNWASESPLIAGLLPLQSSLQSALNSPQVSVFRGTTKVVGTSGSGTTDFLRVTAKLPGKVEGFEPIAIKIASIVLAEDEQVEAYDQIVVSVGYGFDLLIARSNVSQSFSQTPAEWRQALQEASREQPPHEALNVDRE